MAYRSPHRPRTSSARSAIRTIAGAVFLVGAFLAAVYLFRHAADAKRQKEAPSAAPPPAVPAAPVLDVTPASAAFTDAEPQGGGSGTMQRDLKDGLYHLTIHATLPAIDRAKTSYEGWLFSLYPFDYVPLGELATDATGAFMLDWEGRPGKDYATYHEVIVTRQDKASEATPGTHVLDGRFPN